MLLDSKIRPATPEEVDSIRETSDLGPGCLVVAMDNTKGPADLAVLRQVWEIDPLHAVSGGARKAAFIWGLEAALRLQGVPFYYFQVGAAGDEGDWRKVVEKWGAEPVRRDDTTREPVPEIRYKRVL